MAEWKMPPIAKVYEALSAVADGRVHVLEKGKAEVRSSGGDKVYRVRWEGSAYSSSDPASHFQGYIGYPIIAVLLATGAIQYDHELASKLKDVPWKILNDRFKRNYEAAVEHVLQAIPEAAAIRAEAERIYGEIAIEKL